MEKLPSLNRDFFEAIKPRFVELTSKEVFNKEVSFALQILNKNSFIAKCTQNSLLEAVLNISQTGLTLNPALKLAYLVPRYMNGGYQACLEPSYQGLVKLITDTGSVTSIHAHLVYEDDEFSVEYGSTNRIIHKPNPFAKNKKIVGVYAVANLQDKSQQIETMSLEEINRIMEMSESYKAYAAKKVKTCVWVDHFGEMARKTVIRRLVKYLPKTESWSRVAEAIRLDEMDYKPSMSAVQMAENMLLTAALPEEEKSGLYHELSYCSAGRCEEIINYLENNQVDPISSGHNYSQGDILDKQRKMNFQ